MPNEMEPMLPTFSYKQLTEDFVKEISKIMYPGNITFIQESTDSVTQTNDETNAIKEPEFGTSISELIDDIINHISDKMGISKDRLEGKYKPLNSIEE